MENSNLYLALDIFRAYIVRQKILFLKKIKKYRTHSYNPSRKAISIVHLYLCIKNLQYFTWVSPPPPPPCKINIYAINITAFTGRLL